DCNGTMDLPDGCLEPSFDQVAENLPKANIVSGKRATRAASKEFLFWIVVFCCITREVGNTVEAIAKKELTSLDATRNIAAGPSCSEKQANSPQQNFQARQDYLEFLARYLGNLSRRAGTHRRVGLCDLVRSIGKAISRDIYSLCISRNQCS